MRQDSYLTAVILAGMLCLSPQTPAMVFLRSPAPPGGATPHGHLVRAGENRARHSHPSCGQEVTRKEDSFEARIVGGPVSDRSQFGELIYRDTSAAGVRIVFVAPSGSDGDVRKPTRLIVYALPNGNTIEQTMGREVSRGVDWHFGIQHIAAQTRFMRSFVSGWNIVVAYVEAEGLSWPQWKRAHGSAPALLRSLLDTLRSRVRGNPVTLTLTGHSGGGSFIFGVLDARDAIPGWIDRISFLDSNYGFDTTARHGQKLISWLSGGPDRVLSVIAYDDREITLNEKRVVGPDGGTYRRTIQMVAELSKRMPLQKSRAHDLLSWRGHAGRVEVIVHENPDNEILHTRLVERNGFLHAMLLGTSFETQGGEFWGEPAYAEWISAGQEKE